jgi:ribose 5-phosphate isomerase A
LGLSGAIVLRKKEDGSDFITDGGHFILDASFGRISDAKQLNDKLNLIPGVVETGLFIDIATKAVIATPKGVKVMTK